MNGKTLDPDAAADIQALLLRSYGSLGAVRYYFVELGAGFPAWLAARLNGQVKSLQVSPPDDAWMFDARHGEGSWNLNIAFSHRGLERLGLRYEPRRPDPAVPMNEQDHVRDAFQDGMTRDGGVHVGEWSWRDNSDRPLASDALVWITAIDEATLVAAEAASDLGTFPGGTVLQTLDGRRQDSSHFGFADGISQPFLAELHPSDDAEAATGGGIQTESGSWRAVRLGEFLLGHEHEGLSETTRTWVDDGPRIRHGDRLLPHENGTFVVFRRLVQEVELYRAWVLANLDSYRQHLTRQPRSRGVIPDPIPAAVDFTASFIGRYPARVPVASGGDPDGFIEVAEVGLSSQLARPGDPIAAPIGADPASLPAGHNRFRYGDDTGGRSCPLGAHIRRANPRDAQGNAKLSARRRLIRRSFPWVTADERGLAFVAICADIEGQYEFVKKEWLDAGHSLHAGADPDLISGRYPTRPADGDGASQRTLPPKLVLQDTRTPFITTMPDQPLVRASYGEYFFAPSLSMLRQLTDLEVVMAPDQVPQPGSQQAS